MVEQVQAGRLSFREKEGGGIQGDQTGRVETPYLQLVMERVWQEEVRQNSNKLRRKTLRSLGDADTIVRNHLDSIMANFPPDEQAIAERLFLHLVTPSGTKAAHTISDLGEFTGCDVADIQRVIERLSSQEHCILRAIPSLTDLGGAVRYEICHDALSEAIRAWQRRFRAAAKEREYQEELARQQEKRASDQRRARARTRRLQVLLAACFAAVVLFAALAGATYRATVAAERAREKEATQRREAEAARKLADDRLRTIETLNKGQLIREAALSNDNHRLAALLATLKTDSTIRFGAQAQDLRYKNPSGQEVYQFFLFPDPSTVPHRKDSIAFVTYLADHPSFQNTLLTANAGRSYRASYIGWGCLTSVIAVIEYSGHTRAPAVQAFDMCILLGWR